MSSRVRLSFCITALCVSAAGSDNPPPEGCPWDACDPPAGAMGGDGPSAPASDADEPTSEELYRMLYEYCEENDIPFT